MAMEAPEIQKIFHCADPKTKEMKNYRENANLFRFFFFEVLRVFYVAVSVLLF
jgi:hypothetical protein